jgi:hypothetical protein
MRILFDHGTPAPLRRALIGHAVSTAHEMAWSEFDNGALLAAAEAQFDALITTDRNLRHQQNLSGRRLAILVLPTTSWPKIRAQEAQVVAAVNALRVGDVVELNFS